MSQTSAETLTADVVINGGNLAAPAAALAAARAWPGAKILLIEPSDWLGGQATSQGVAAPDNSWFEPGASLMRNNPTEYYAADYLDFLNRLKSPPSDLEGTGFAPNGTNWVSRDAFDPRSAADILDRMMDEQSAITLKKLTVVKDVATSPSQDGGGQVINSLQLIERVPKPGYQPFDLFVSEELPDWYSAAESDQYTKVTHQVLPVDEARGIAVIDASELADVIVLSGAEYTVGRELTTEEFSEAGDAPAMDEDGSQAFVYVFAMTDAPTPDQEDDLKTPWPDFDTYYADQVSNFFSFTTFTWNRIWTYRRLLTTGLLFDFDTVNQGDVSMQNWFPGNDYPYGTLYKNKADAQAEAADWMGGALLDELAQAEKHAVAWYFYMKAQRPTTWDTEYLAGDHALNMMGTKHGLAKFPYIRGTRRINGLQNFRITERTFDNVDASDYDGRSSFRFFDSVGIGHYASDVHPTNLSQGIAPSFGKPAPFYIPYRAIGSSNVRNLLAAGKTMAQTYITNSAYRLHPIEWASGSAAGVAAALMARDGVSNLDLLTSDTTLQSLQAQVDGNSPIHWSIWDDEPIPAQRGDLIVNDRRPLVAGVPFRIEAYHPTAVRAVFYQGDTQLGESTTRANGRLLLANITSQSASSAIRVELFDTDDELITELSIEATGDENVVDDAQPVVSFTGSWTLGTAQPNKYATSYHFTNGTGGLKTATFPLPIGEAGIYQVDVWYPEAGNRAIDSPFTIHHADGETEQRINQQTQGGQWVSLGEYTFSGTANDRVVLSNNIFNTSQLVVADAIRVTFVRKASSGGSYWKTSEAALNKNENQLASNN
jgi:hypothetical protein